MIISSTTEKGIEKKYGTFLGVFVPSLLTILGVIMYLRMGWVVANAGIVSTILILTIATSITFITGLSVSATATNMRVRSGGVYYMVSRCFGIEAGAAIGIPLYLSQAVGITFYVAGFSEAIHSLVPALPTQIVTVITLFGILGLSYFSADLALKSQVFILTVIVASLISFLSGPGLSDEVKMAAQPFEGVSFWVVFAVFFPAVTGITTGISMSGDLKNPTKSIPIGTMAAIAAGSLVYLIVALFLWWRVPAELLASDPLIMRMLSSAPWLIIAGIAGSTLSSAIGSLLAGPRTLQAMANDGVGPGFLAKGFGPNQDPRYATVFTFLVALGFSLFGGIDAIAPILTMFFLTSYAALNLAAGLEGLTNNPSWRPSFKVPWAISLVGSTLCFVAMLFIDSQSAIVAVVFCFGVFILMSKLRKHTQWEDIRRGLLMHVARVAVYRLSSMGQSARNWRPHMLVLSGSPSSRWYLIEIANAISQGRGFLVVASIVGRSVKRDQISRLEQSMSAYLTSKNIEGLVKIKSSRSNTEGIKQLISDYGLGALTPNTIVVGVSEDEGDQEERADKLAHILSAVHRSSKNAVVVRKSGGGGAYEETLAEPWQHGDIDIWWGRKKKNATLMLILGYMLQSSAEWMGSKLTLKTFVETKEQDEAISKYLTDFLRKSRISAEIDVQRIEDRMLYSEKIREFSKDSGIIILGIRPIEEGESHEGYCGYLKDLIARTVDYPTTLFVLSGEEISFQDILL